MTTVSQDRSKYALEKVEANLQIKKLKPLSASCPSMILQNGLGQTIAFYLAKNEKHHSVLVAIIIEWLKKQGYIVNNDSRAFIKEIATIDQNKYFMLQDETLKLLEWVKRYANAFIEDKI